MKLIATCDSPVRERLLRPLATGELMAGIAFAPKVRAFPRVPVRAVAERGGWRFDGRAPWYTGWGLNDVLLPAGVTDTAEVVFVVTDAREQPGLTPSAPMRLAALTAARTAPWSWTACGCRRSPWCCACRGRSSPGSTWRGPPTPVRPCSAWPARRWSWWPGPVGEETARALRERLDGVRRECYELADHPAPHECVPERLAVRTRAFDAMRAATTAAIVAGGGRAMALGSRAQRLAREGMFLLVQGQTSEARRTHLGSLASGWPGPRLLRPRRRGNGP